VFLELFKSNSTFTPKISAIDFALKVDLYKLGFIPDAANLPQAAKPGGNQSSLPSIISPEVIS